MASHALLRFGVILGLLIACSPVISAESAECQYKVYTNYEAEETSWYWHDHKLDGDITVENGSLTKLDKNSFLVDVFDSGSFKLAIKGFDIRRVPILKADAYNKTELPTVASRTK